MSVKLIAVDMDGTFLDDKKQYNKSRFLSQYAQLKQQDIKFVVASGNQYYQLKSFFPEIADEIAFVAENGAYIVNQGQDFSVAALDKDAVKKILDFRLLDALYLPPSNDQCCSCRTALPGNADNGR